MRILAIETSCDETALALVECRGGITAPRFKVLKNFVASQIAIHRPFGGVVPNLAKREHQKNLPVLFKKIETGNWEMGNIDLIAVTVGPGLEPALWTGIEFAKKLYRQLKTENSKLKIIGANHLEGHLYSFLLPKKNKVSNFQFLLSKNFPAIGLIVSGGHTTLLTLKDLKTRKKLGETRDDAVGEAFDKVARILGLPYPGGPEIEKIARKGNPDATPFPRPMMHTKDYDFSFSGLKTSVLYFMRDNPRASKPDVAASFQKAAVDVLVYKTMRAAREFGAKSITLSGGVAANKALRKALQGDCRKNDLQFFVADFIYNTDNAAMIAATAYLNLFQKKKYPLVANGGLNIK